MRPLPLLSAALGGVPHGFFGRNAGNCGLGSNDDPAMVAANRHAVAEAVLPGAPLVALYQVHSADCVTVGQPWQDSARPRADAAATRTPGVLLSVLTADCAPVLLADAEAGVVGAAHAGWRGALAGVTDTTIEAMVGLGARRERIAAAIGPAIGRVFYEVDDDFYSRFLAVDRGNGRFFSEGYGERPHFDLSAYVAHRLEAAGIGRVEPLQRDTFGDEDGYFSYRRASQRGEPDYGRQIAIIGLAPRPDGA